MDTNFQGTLVSQGIPIGPEVTIKVDTGERLAIALALAKLALERPGWMYYLREIARKLEVTVTFDEFCQLHK